MLAVGMGRPPLMRFTSSGVKVYSEQRTPMVGEAVKVFLSGACEEMRLEDACNHH